MDDPVSVFQLAKGNAIEAIKTMENFVKLCEPPHGIPPRSGDMPTPDLSPVSDTEENHKRGGGLGLRQGPIDNSTQTENTAKGNNAITNPQHSQGPAVHKSHLQELSTKIADNVSQLGHDDTAGIKAATAALELAALLRPPGDTIMGWFANMSVVSAVRLFIHWGCFEAIPEDKGESISYNELSAKVKVEVQLLSMFPFPLLLRKAMTDPTL